MLHNVCLEHAYASLSCALGRRAGVLNDPGQSLKERQLFLSAVQEQMTGWKEEEGYPAGGGKIVVGGAGIVAVELAGNLSEALIAQGKRGILTLLVGSHGLLPTYPTRVQATVREQKQSKQG